MLDNILANLKETVRFKMKVTSDLSKIMNFRFLLLNLENEIILLPVIKTKILIMPIKTELLKSSMVAYPYTHST